VTSDDTGRPPLDLARLDAATSRWATVEVLDAAPSTNAVVAERARAGAAEGLVVVAEHQTAGRGRLDRSWVTPPRSALTFSVLLRPEVPVDRWPWLPLLAGTAVVEGVAEAGGPRCGLKWPNDVMYDGLKLAGLLVERVESARGPAAVLGIGLNVSTGRDELPVSTAGSLVTAGMTEPDRTTLLLHVLAAVEERYRSWTAVHGDPSVALAEGYAGLCETLGQEVRVQLPSGDQLIGTAVGIALDGGLQVEGGSGVVTVSAGDVIHVRPR
jgi:BirA family transcriptional regulator, biotin operon repressor / biotin---[acetyl-CoA-carboxylase] ligase